MKKTAILLIIIFAALGLWSQVIEEGFETGDFSAYEWVLSGQANWFVTGSYPFEGDYCAQGGNVNDNQMTTIEIDIECSQSGILAFAWKVSSEPNYDYLRFYLDDDLVAEISGTVAWTQLGYELTAGLHNLRWSYEKDYSVSNGYDIGWIDDIFFFTEEEEYSYDLEVVGMSGASYLLGGNTYTYEVTVRNNGQFNVTGYTVSLVDAAGTEYASETVFWMLPPGDERLVELELQPDEAVADTLMGIYGYGYLQTDENPQNDYSEKHDIHLAGADCQFAQIGSDTTYTTLLPVNFRRRASVYESMYFSEELTGTGAITSLDFFNNFANAIENIQMSIWLGETEAGSLENGWIGADSLQLVYSGEFDFPAGDNTVNIRLDELYEYNGGNLVMLINKAYEEDEHSWQSNFNFSELPGEEAGRTRFSYSDLSGFDPVNVTEGVLCDWVANTVFTISPVPYGHLSGYIYGEGVASIPLTGSEISIDDGLWTAVTDSTGYFLIEQIEIGMHQVFITHPDYYPELYEIEIFSGELTEIEITLQQESDIDEDQLSKNSLIKRVYPNPYYAQHNRGGIRFELDLASSELPASLNIYNIKGRKVAVKTVSEAGQIRWDGMVQNRPAASGIYFLKLTAPSGQEDTARLLIIK